MDNMLVAMRRCCGVSFAAHSRLSESVTACWVREDVFGGQLVGRLCVGVFCDRLIA
jgi:hypothetical protein